MALSTNLLAYWKLDESSGDAADATGNGYTLTNNNSVGYAAALINNGADFGATDNHSKYLYTNTPPTIPTAGAFSISLWVKIRTAPAINQERSIFSYSKAYDSKIDINDYGDGTYRYIRVMTEGSDRKYKHTLSTSSFTHIVVTYPSSGDGKLYINGTYVYSLGRAGSLSGGNAMYLGTQLSCYIDEVGAWNKELTEAEVTELYNGGLGLAYPFPNVSTNNFFQLF